MTILQDRIIVAELALLTGDLDRAERSALTRICAALESEAHRQTAFNPALVDYESSPQWYVWEKVPPLEPGTMFGYPDRLMIGAGERGALPRHDLDADARTVLGDPTRSVRGYPCTYSDDHTTDCVCSGYRVARHLRHDFLPDGSPWLRLTERIPNT